MASPKPIDFTGARLSCGGNYMRPDPSGEQEHIVYFREWRVRLANGDLYERSFPDRVWKRWTVPSRDAYQSEHWRKASAKHTEQLEAWARSHPDYIRDDHRNRYRREFIGTA